MLPTAEYVRSFMSYDPNTGLLWWTKPKSGRKLQVPAGSKTNTGHLSVRIDGKAYLAHRVAWLIQTGEWPEDKIDHKDGCGTNNRWANLRCCSQKENVRNTRLAKNNKSGFKGVSFHRKNRTWAACICVDRRTVHLGTYKNKLDAAAAYDAAAKQYFGEFARTS